MLAMQPCSTQTYNCKQAQHSAKYCGSIASMDTKTSLDFGEVNHKNQNRIRKCAVGEREVPQMD